MRVKKILHFGFVFHAGDGVKAAVKNRYEDAFAGFDSSELAALSADLEANLAEMLAGSDTPELPDASDDPEDAFASLAAFVYEPDQRGDESPETLSRSQRAVVNAAIKKAKQQQGFERRGDALFHICELFLEEHGA